MPCISNYTPFKHSFESDRGVHTILVSSESYSYSSVFYLYESAMSASHFCLLWPLFLPNLPNDTFILGSAVHICSYWFFKRCFDCARYGMCNLTLFCSIMLPQSATQVFMQKMVCRCTISTDFPLYVSRHTLFPHFPCVACRVNSLSLRTISIYLLKLFRCQSFVLSIIVQNIQLPKYTWFDSTNRWNQFI